MTAIRTQEAWPGECSHSNDKDHGNQPLQVVTQALRYCDAHGDEPIVIPEMAAALGTTEACLQQSFASIRGMTPAEALLEHRLNRLFSTLRDRPRQSLQEAIRLCGLGQTADVPGKFAQTFGIEMPLFRRTCRRAADDRRFRRRHPQAEALVLHPDLG